MKDILKVFLNLRMLSVLCLGFASGLPLALTASTLQAWMVDVKIDLKIVGLFALVGLPYTLKFLWSPLFDRFKAPFGFSKFGKRRGWLFIIQIFLFISIAALGFTRPDRFPVLTALFALLISFFSATQDILIDAYKTEILDQKEFGAGSGIYTMGYRIAMVVSGGLALILADHLSWKMIYLTMAVISLSGPLTVIFAAEPKNPTKPLLSLKEAFVLPLADFFKRRGSFEMLGFILLYKLDVAMTLAMMTAFFLTLGFSKTEIGVVSKWFGMLATISGTLLGGAVMVRLGIRTCLWIFGITQAFSGLSFYALAHLGHNYSMMVVAITAESFFSGMGIAAFSAFMMSLCNKRFTATQYALLSSFMGLTRYVAAAPSGFLIEAVGWKSYFVICTLAGIPGLLLLTRYSKWNLHTNS